MNLRDRVNIVQASFLVDAHGNEVPGWGSPSRQYDVAADVQPATTAEETADRQTAVTRWRIFLPASADVLVTDRIEWRGLTLEVDGEPERWRRRGVPHHIELLARRIDG